MVFKIARILFKETYPLKYNYKKDKQRSISSFIGIGLLLVVAMILYWMISFLDYSFFLEEGRSQEIITNGLIVAAFFTIVSSSLHLIYIFNYYDDYSLFLTMPLNTTTIIWGKIVYVIETKMIIAVPLSILPVFIFGIYTHEGILFWIKAIGVILFNILFLIVGLAFIIFLLMCVINWKKIKEYISATAQIVVITIFVLALSNVNNLSINIIGSNILPRTNNIFQFYNKLVGFIVGDGDFIGGFYMSLLILIPSVLLVVSLFSSRWIVKIMQKQVNNSNGNNKLKGNYINYIRKRPFIQSMLHNDFMVLVRCPDFLVNSILISYMVLLTLIVNYCKNTMAYQNLCSFLEKDVYTSCILLSVALSILGCINSVNATSFSRDRMSSINMRIYPIKDEKYIAAKYILVMAQTLIQILISAIICYKLLHLKFIIILFAFLLSIPISLLINYNLVINDYREPKTDWKEPYQLMKINLKMIRGILVSLLLVLIFLFGIVLVLENTHITFLSILSGLVILAIEYGCIFFIRNKYIQEKRTGIKYNSTLLNIIKYAGIYLVVQLIIPVLISLIIPAFIGNDMDQLVDLYFNNILIIMLICQVVTLLLYKMDLFGKGFKLRDYCDITWNKTNLIKSLFVGFTMYLVVQGIIQLILLINGNIQTTGFLDNLVKDSDRWITVLVIAVTSPIIEEIIFRGLILKELQRITNTKIAIIIQAVLFGLYHMNLLQAIYGTLCGVVLGYSKERSKSLVTPILIHIVFNSLGVLSDKLQKNYMIRMLLIIIYSISAIYALCSFIIDYRKKKQVNTDKL